MHPARNSARVAKRAPRPSRLRKGEEFTRPACLGSSPGARVDADLRRNAAGLHPLRGRARTASGRPGVPNEVERNTLNLGVVPLVRPDFRGITSEHLWKRSSPRCRSRRSARRSRPRRPPATRSSSRPTSWPRCSRRRAVSPSGSWTPSARTSRPSGRRCARRSSRCPPRAARPSRSRRRRAPRPRPSTPPRRRPRRSATSTSRRSTCSSASRPGRRRPRRSSSRPARPPRPCAPRCPPSAGARA